MRKDELVCLMKKSFSPVCRNVLLYLLTPHFVLKMCEKSKNKKILCRGFDPARKVKKMNLVFLFFFSCWGSAAHCFLFTSVLFRYNVFPNPRKLSLELSLSFSNLPVLRIILVCVLFNQVLAIVNICDGQKNILFSY